MGKLINWFWLKLDRKTHDSKFHVFQGKNRQEINLQIQAELSKTNQSLNNAITKCEEETERADTYKGLYENTKLMYDTIKKEHTEFANIANKVNRSRKAAIKDLEDAIYDMALQIENLQQQLKLANQVHPDMHDYKIAIQNPECNIVRLEVCYSEHKSLLDAYSSSNGYNTRKRAIALLNTDRSTQFALDTLIKNVLINQKITQHKTTTSIINTDE